MTDLVFGRVPHPPFVDRLIPNSATYAWNDLGERRALGVCQHSMVGSLLGTDRYFRSGASGLTDYGIGGSTDGDLDGVIYRWNDPLGRRSPWANGGSDGLEGDGPMFVRTLGIDAINRDLVSIERSDGGDTTTPMSPAQFEAICQLTAYWFDQHECPWNIFPVNPKVGIVTHMLHFEFAVKACPFTPVRSKINPIQDRIRAILEAHQVVSTPVTPTPPVVTPPRWPNGWTTEALAAQFGKVLEITVSKRNAVTGTRMLPFDQNGVISNAWVHRAMEEGITDVKRIPKPSHITLTQSKDGVTSSSLIVPRSGYKDWIAFKGDGNSAWRWVY